MVCELGCNSGFTSGFLDNSPLTATLRQWVRVSRLCLTLVHARGNKIREIPPATHTHSPDTREPEGCHSQTDPPTEGGVVVHVDLS